MRAAPVTYAILVAAVLGTLACDEELVFTDPSVLDISASVSADSILPGTPVTITVTIANRTDRRVEFERSCPIFRVVITNSEGEDVRRTGGCVIPFQPVTEVFQPGEAKHFSVSWTAEFGSHRSDPADRTPVAPGTYRVLARLHSRLLVESEPVPLEVLPAWVLALGLDEKQAEVGDTVRITTSLENRLPRPVEFDLVSACTFGVFVVADSEEVADLSGDCSIVERELALAAHERHQETTIWIPSDPGDYRIEAQLGKPTLEGDLRAQERLVVTPR